MPKCKTCPINLWWLKHATTGKSAPIESQPSANGNIAVLGNGFYTIIPASERHEWEGNLHLNHWATCTNPPPRGGGKAA